MTRESRPFGTAFRVSAPDWNRTSDLWYRKPTLYPLSYGGVPIEVITSPAVARTSATGSVRGRSSSASWGASATTSVAPLIAASASASRVAR